MAVPFLGSISMDYDRQDKPENTEEDHGVMLALAIMIFCAFTLFLMMD